MISGDGWGSVDFDNSNKAICTFLPNGVVTVHSSGTINIVVKDGEGYAVDSIKIVVP